MQKLLKIFLSTFIFFLSFQALQAQPPGRGRGGTPEERVDRQVKSMSEQLTLSEAQAGKVKEVLLTYSNKMSDLRKEADGDWTGMREKMGELRTEQNEELKKYLTEEQYTNWEKYQAEQRERRGDRTRDRDGERRKRGKKDGDKKRSTDKQDEKTESGNGNG